MNKLKKLTPYDYEKITTNTFIVNLNGEKFLTFQNINEEQVDKTTKLLNGAFREGVIFGQFNKIENLQ